MRRRAFLRAATGGALAAALLPRPIVAQTPAPKRRAASALLSDPALDRIDARMRTLLRETGTPGAALAVVQDGELAWQGAYGVADAETRKPVDAHTLFEAASVSKTVFAYVALKLCERGTLGLDTPLTRFSKQRFFTGDPQLDAVTPRHVLSHTTGFPEWRSKEPLKCHTKPGERFLYSGEGYYYLQSVMTDVAGRRLAAPCGRYEADFEVCATDFDEFMCRTLLDPLGMTESTYIPHERFAAHLARRHDVEGRPLPRRKASAADVARYGAAGELRTTVSDLAKFLCAMLTPPKGDAFLGPAMHA
ncbi:MAG TPA: serine hydrolase domain-containing protein, partial [Opitutaceae bacterium]